VAIEVLGEQQVSANVFVSTSEAKEEMESLSENGPQSNEVNV
jgi:hypothetical protein